MPEAMTSRERVEAALRLQKPDRVPVAPVMLFFAGRYGGITAEEYLFDFGKAEAAVEKTFDDLGPWDAWYIYPCIDGRATMLSPVKYKLPGRELPPDAIYQAIEQPIMTVEDYDVIIDKGYSEFYRSLLRRSYPDQDPDEMRAQRASIKQNRQQFISKWHARGVPTINGLFVSLAFDEICYFRSLKEFMLDLRRRPDKVREALRLATPVIADIAIRNARSTEALGVWVSGQRCSTVFISGQMFERFVLEDLHQMVQSITNAGLLMTLHFEENWTQNLPYLADIPRGTCALALDGHTDIFAAKRLLGDRMCIIGDVPAALLSLGTTQQVEDYCKRLIERVGRDGGFILGSGSEVPFNARPENVKALAEAAERWGRY